MFIMIKILVGASEILSGKLVQQVVNQSQSPPNPYGQL